jgi:hypothetical protein
VASIVITAASTSQGRCEDQRWGRAGEVLSTLWNGIHMLLFPLEMEWSELWADIGGIPT